MKVLIINRWPLSEVPYHLWFGRNVYAVLFTTQDCLDVSARHLELYSEVVIFKNPPDADWEFRAVERYSHSGIEVVIALAERDILRASRIRKSIAAGGQDVESALAYRDKLNMKRYLYNAGIPVPEFRAIDSATDLIEFFNLVKAAPIVVKPRRGASSVGVRVLRSMPELLRYVREEECFSGDNPVHLLAEEYVEHVLFQTNGLVRDRSIELLWPAVSSTGAGFESGREFVSNTLDVGSPFIGPLSDITAQALAALPSPDLMLFHAEIFGLPDGRLVFNEVGSRVGGDQIREEYELAYGLDLVERFVRLSLGGDVAPLKSPIPIRQAGHAHLPPLAGKVRSVPPAHSPIEGVTWDLSVSLGDTLAPATSSAQTMISMLATGNTSAEVLRRLRAAIATARDHFVIS